MSDAGSRAARYIEGLIRAEPRSAAARERLGLAPVERLLARLGDPQRGLRCVHVAGSKGKGSTALLLEAAMGALGLRTGTYTSPHLEHWRERYRVQGRPISGALLDRCIDRLRPHVADLAREDPDFAPSFFDVLTAAALLLFREQALDYAIMETGLGGRLDATNVVQPAVTCITSIELEHTARLGREIPRIAFEKAGIIKRGAPLVLGRVPPEADAVIRARAGTLGVPVLGLGREIPAALSRQGGECRVDLPIGAARVALTLPHPALFMAHNAALALACLDALGLLAEAPGRRRATGAIVWARIPGRAEILNHAPMVVVDGAHTRESAAALADFLGALEHDAMDVVVSLSADKDPAVVLPALLTRARRVYATTAERRRSRPAKDLAAAIRRLAPALEVHEDPDPARAVATARRALAPRDLLCITGSMYLAGAARRVLLGDACPKLACGKTR